MKKYITPEISMEKIEYEFPNTSFVHSKKEDSKSDNDWGNLPIEELDESIVIS